MPLPKAISLIHKDIQMPDRWPDEFSPRYGRCEPRSTLKVILVVTVLPLFLLSVMGLFLVWLTGPKQFQI
jgi:hypothetical protein